MGWLGKYPPQVQCHDLNSLHVFPKEYRWREMEEHRQAERLQRQLQQEQAYLLSLQHDHRRQQQQQQQQQQERNKQSYHTPEPKAHYEPTERAREVILALVC